MTPLNEKLIAAYATARKHHADVCTLMQEVNTQTRSMDQAVIVDAAYILKRTSELADETRKEIDRTLVMVQKLGCMAVMHTEDDKLHGEIANGHGLSGQELIVPDKNKQPKEYLALMKAIGVSEEQAVNPLIKPGWKEVAEWSGKLASEGKPIPPGLEQVKRVAKFTVVARQAKGVDIDELADRVILKLPLADDIVSGTSHSAHFGLSMNSIETLVCKLANRIQSKSTVHGVLEPYSVASYADNDIPF